MAPPDWNVLKLASDTATAAYRSAPHNIEAEQGLLGAILVNNDAFYRVSDFLEPRHFFETVHQKIYETAGSLIRMGKVATPVTLKTFFPAEADILGMTVSQYLARLAAEATTIINAQDYGRTIYDLSLRRDLIGIGEDMVNVAYDAPVDFAPRAQIEQSSHAQGARSAPAARNNAAAARSDDDGDHPAARDPVHRNGFVCIRAHGGTAGHDQ